MKYQTKDTRYGEVVIEDFGGLDRAAALCGGKNSFELRNFRRMEDGSLKRRGGLVPLATFGQDIRGAISILRGGVRETYVVAGSTVYTVEEAEGEWLTNPIATLESGEGEVTFLEHGGHLILLDGEQFYCLNTKGATVLEAYAPLYGTEWDDYDTAGRTVYEQPNLLSRRIRIRVRMHIEGYYIYLSPLQPASVDVLLVNGERYQKEVRLNTAENRIETSSSLPKGAEIEVYLTMPEDFAPMLSDIKRARRACALGRAEDARILFYDHPDKSTVYISRTIPKGAQQSVCGVLSDACMIYVTREDEVTVGDGIHAVTGGCRHYDRSLIFTAKGSWMADGQVNEDGGLRLIPVNTTLGCSRSGAVAVSGNRPFTMFTSGLLSWSSETDERNECNAEVVSRAVHPLLKDGFDQKMTLWADTVRDEIWCYEPGSDGRVLVYQARYGSWTSFDGFTPYLVFDLGGEPGIVMGSALYRMQEDAYRDTILYPEHPSGAALVIKAEYQSAFLDFEAPGRKKRICRASVVGVLADGGVTLSLQRVDGEQRKVLLWGGEGEIRYLQSHVDVGRFRFVRVGVRSDTGGPLHLYQVRLETQPSE